MGLMRNLLKIFSFILPILPYIFLAITLLWGGTFIYEKVTNFISSSFTSMESSLRGEFEQELGNLSDEQRRIFNAISDYGESVSIEYDRIESNLRARERALDERERRLERGQEYLNRRFTELQELTDTADEFSIYTDELLRRYYNGELEISIYEYLGRE